MGKKYFLIIICIYIHALYVSSLVPRLKDEYKPPRDYRPSKWISNSALDVWFGNKSMVDILAREFNQIVDRIANRPARATIHTDKELNGNISFKDNTAKAMNIKTPANAYYNSKEMNHV